MEGLVQKIENTATSAQEKVQSALKAIHDATMELSTVKKTYSQVIQSKPTYKPSEYPFGRNPLEDNSMKEI